MEHKSSVDKNGRRPLAGAAVQRTDVTLALTRAFFAEWARVGYADLSLDRVARVAGSGKAALYRRWGDKAAMAADLLPRVGLTLTDVADAGSLEADVLAFLLAIRRVLRHPMIKRVLADIHAELGRNTGLAAVIRPFQAARRARTDALIDRAIGRGELAPTVDRDLVTDLIAAPIYWRMVVSGRSMTNRQLSELADAISVAMRASGR